MRYINEDQHEVQTAIFNGGLQNMVIAVAVIDVEMNQWAAYIGGVDREMPERDAAEKVAQLGAKLLVPVAEAVFPYVKLDPRGLEYRR